MQVTKVQVFVEGNVLNIDVSHDGAEPVQLAASAYQALRDAEFRVEGETFTSIDVEDWLA